MYECSTLKYIKKVEILNFKFLLLEKEMADTRYYTAAYSLLIIEFKLIIYSITIIFFL